MASNSEYKLKSIQHLREWESKNRDKLKILNKIKYERLKVTPLYKKQNTARVLKRMRTETEATPPWADIDKICEMYANRPKGFHVDHIIPLRGKNVCGLNVHYNMQYLSAKENMSKGNKL